MKRVSGTEVLDCDKDFFKSLSIPIDYFLTTQRLSFHIQNYFSSIFKRDSGQQYMCWEILRFSKWSTEEKESKIRTKRKENTTDGDSALSLSISSSSFLFLILRERENEACFGLLSPSVQTDSSTELQQERKRKREREKEQQGTAQLIHHLGRLEERQGRTKQEKKKREEKRWRRRSRGESLQEYFAGPTVVSLLDFKFYSSPPMHSFLLLSSLK